MSAILKMFKLLLSFLPTLSAIKLTSSAPKVPTILVYNDFGAAEYVVGDPGFFKAQLQPSLPFPAQISFIDHQGIIAGDWKESTDILLMPGGFDRGYCKYLNGKGNEQIKSFINDYGGKYLGFCAGSYYASQRCVFDMFNFRGDNAIIGERELSFFPGDAEGPVLGPYNAENMLTSKIAFIKANEETYPCYYNGGPFFRGAEGMDNLGVRVLGTYENNQYPTVKGLPAIVEINVPSSSSSNKNGKVILCGAHPEVSDEWLKRITKEVPNADKSFLEQQIIPPLQNQRYRHLMGYLVQRLLGSDVSTRSKL